MNTGTVLILALILAVKIFFLRRFIKSLFAPNPANDFTFGNKDLLQISKAITKSDFTNAEQRLRQLDSDNLSQAVDHIVLCCTEKQLKKFYDSGNGRAAASLLLGARDLYMAWKLRGHKAASELKDKQFAGFVEHLKLSGPKLQEACATGWTSAEANSRLIRVHMSLGYADAAEDCFKAAVKADPTHLWAYLHYAECIQPKWGGSIEQVQQFMQTLPDHYLIRTAVRLKLMYDSYMSSENYFNLGDSADEVNKFVEDMMRAVDAELTAGPPASVHRYILYGYMYVLTGIACKEFEKKYKKLLNGNYTLYPFGIL